MVHLRFCTVVYTGIALSILGLFALLGYKANLNKEDAKFLAEKVDYTSAAFECTIELEREELSHDAKQKLRLLAGISGTEVEDIHVLTFQGGINGGKLYSRITPRNGEAAITELYFSSSIDVFKVSTLYNSLREQVQKNSFLLGKLMPAWSDNEYMSVKQLETLLSADFSFLSDFTVPIEQLKRSETEYQMLLFIMSKDGDTYTIDKNGLYLSIDLGREDNQPVSISFSVENPAENLSFLKLLHIDYNPEELKVMKKISGTMELRLQIFSMPSNIIQDSTVRKLKELQIIFDQFTK